jgi:hypothetical protein
MTVLQAEQTKSQLSFLDKKLEEISHQLLNEEAKRRELENRLKIQEVQWKIEKAALEEKVKSVSYA